jgi:desulfoferrodoxin-like iron-binding protein
VKYEDFKEALKKRAQREGYILNPDESFLESMFQGLNTNLERYGYPSCPCRISEGSFQEDIDIICPCIYRDPDLYQYGRCFCGMYVTEAYIKNDKKPIVPNRRPLERAEIKNVGKRIRVKKVGQRYRCKSCGNEVLITKVGGGVLVCCGLEMELIKEEQ